ncbi:MAG: histidine kinase [Proteobacteria bacterium]|nr:histidine kinase [Pseudomonadota bacterium]
MSTIAPNQRRRLRLILTAVFVLLLIPTITLAYLGYRQLQFESFYQHQSMAVELTARIEARASALFEAEDAKSFVDFGFLIVGEGNYVQRSPLSTFPVEGDLPGLLSYFQVDADGVFSTPLLPKPSKRDATSRVPEDIEPGEYQQRLALQRKIRQQLEAVVVSKEELRGDLSTVDAEIRTTSPFRNFTSDGSPQPELEVGQKIFDRLNAPEEKPSELSRSFNELKLDYLQEADDALAPLYEKVAGKAKLRTRRLEKNTEAVIDQDQPFADIAQRRLTTFESEVDPFRFDVIDENHFVLYRNVWRDQQRFVQGAVIELKVFLQGLIGTVYRGTNLASVSNLIVVHQGDVIHRYLDEVRVGHSSTVGETPGTLLYRARLTAPVNDIELVFRFTRLPIGPGGMLIAWTTFALLAILIGGFTLLYRVGLRQIALVEQQQDFVSAVSHELKTPLTSIRMYGEILKAGWASEEKKRSYYDFIFQESERLTRLINNVLRLARFNRNGTDLELHTTTVGELVDLARSKIATHVEQAGFELAEQHDDLNLVVEADTDAFVQIMINLIDNALKFSANATEKKVSFSSRLRGGSSVEFAVRDYGPGVPRDQMKKIFKLFYRTERELTRETVGTGIGLALVHELVTAMGGSVDVKNSEPGAEFRVRLPLRAPQVRSMD